MTDEFKESFSNLSLYDKRKQINNELIIISEIIKLKEDSLKIPSAMLLKKYDKESLSESETYDILYENIYNIQREIITLFSIDEK